MQMATRNAILMMAQADESVTTTQISKLEQFIKGIDSATRPVLITGKAARLLLGEAEEHAVSRPYLAQLVQQGRLHPVKLSARKIRYDKNEVMALLSNGGEK
ncbi:MAG: hypothetical protein VB042_09685 [Victivallaceae bacterium]|nr:hypothetical protein [Victivallaceae bacterium]